MSIVREYKVFFLKVSLKLYKELPEKSFIVLFREFSQHCCYAAVRCICWSQDVGKQHDSTHEKQVSIDSDGDGTVWASRSVALRLLLVFTRYSSKNTKYAENDFLINGFSQKVADKLAIIVQVEPKIKKHCSNPVITVCGHEHFNHSFLAY